MRQIFVQRKYQKPSRKDVKLTLKYRIHFIGENLSLAPVREAREIQNCCIKT